MVSIVQTLQQLGVHKMTYQAIGLVCPPLFFFYILTGYQDVDGRIILRWIFRKLEGVVGTGWS
jgi:hypothetical protein